MKTNYHTHTYRCGHAEGTDEEMVQSAVQRGLTVCGISDHAPFRFPEGHESGFRIPTALAEDYMNSFRALRIRYQNEIEMPIGFEMEYYPLYFKDMLAYAKALGGEYLILGQHHVNNEHPATPPGATADPDVFDQYVSNIMDGLESGVYSYVAHPDLVLRHDPTDDELEKLRPICKRAKELGIPLEINFHGLLTNRAYPHERFWEMAAGEHNDVIFGCDAHRPDQLTELETEEKALKIVRKYNLHLIESLELRTL